MHDGEFDDPGTITEIEGWAADVVISARLPPAELQARVASFVSPLGIDVARFGDSAC